MEISSRTPEGDSSRCHVCGKPIRIEPSRIPTPDAPCPHCGSLLWFPDSPRPSIEETRKQINRLFEEVARLAEMDLAPTDFYGEFLKRVLQALAAPAGAVWGRTAQGNLQLQYAIGMREVGLDRTQEGRESHDELLRKAVTQPQPRYLPPHSNEGGQAGGPGAGNPTDYIILLVPVVVDNQVAGLLEVWQAPDRHPNAIRGFLEFMMRMAELASRCATKAGVGDA